MKSPPPLHPAKPVRLVFVGGFLGAGKTTALGALAKMLIGRGFKLGIVTNDQSANLADTLIVRQMLSELDVPVEEVVAGCFCCKFDELIGRMDKILAHAPDILLGEPVGSCTDFVAAVANPIRIHYSASFTLAPFSTLVDPQRVRELLLGEKPTLFPEEVSYLFAKQLEEAELIVLNKSDTIDKAECRRLTEAIQKRFAGKPVLGVSARTGQGMSAWLDELVAGSPRAGKALVQIDYDRYARAEAVLGWLNAAVEITAPQPFEPANLIERLIGRIQGQAQRQGAGIGHLKLTLSSKGQTMWANLTGLDAVPSLSDFRLAPSTGAILLVNARIQMAPAQLEQNVLAALMAEAAEMGLGVDVLELQCFSPAYPDPPYLVRDDV